MYHVDIEQPGTLQGQCAAELFLDGQVICRKNILGDSGIAGPVYSKDALDANYKVFSLENDVLAFMTPDALENQGEAARIIDAVFLTVNENGELIYMERHYTDEELAVIARSSQKPTTPELRYFRVTDDYTVDGNRIIFHSDWDMTNAENEASAGENTYDIPILFDFTNFDVTCEDDYFETVVYYQ